jgi:hypothetical protein
VDIVGVRFKDGAPIGLGATSEDPNPSLIPQLVDKAPSYGSASITSNLQPKTITQPQRADIVFFGLYLCCVIIYLRKETLLQHHRMTRHKDIVSGVGAEALGWPPVYNIG